MEVGLIGKHVTGVERPKVAFANPGSGSRKLRLIESVQIGSGTNRVGFLNPGRDARRKTGTVQLARRAAVRSEMAVEDMKKNPSRRQNKYRKKMIAASLVAHSSVPFRCYRACDSLSQCSLTKFQFVKFLGIPNQQSLKSFRHMKCAPIRAKGHRGISYVDGFNNGYNNESFWLTMLRDVAWSLRSLTIFLVEQPSQLKYIEWPTFQSTLKTATLTLVLVALLIVTLSSVDSSFCYILALLLRNSS